MQLNRVGSHTGLAVPEARAPSVKPDIETAAPCTSTSRLWNPTVDAKDALRRPRETYNMETSDAWAGQ
jgi:hypothetical protein